MHRSNYETPICPPPEGEQAEPWRPVPPEGPYGPVPGEVPVLPPPAPYRTPPAWGRRPVGRAGGKTFKGTRIFAFFLAAILLLTGTALFLYPENLSLPFSAGWDDWDSGVDWDYYGEDWRQALEDTSVERAPTGDGTVLTLIQAEGEALTAREIYRRVSPAIVEVQASLNMGTSLGTGIVMSPNGYIITNAHVIAGSRRVKVVLSDDREEEALLVGYDGESDLAVLKIDAQDLPAAVFGDSSALQVGDPAYAIGNPLGGDLRRTMTDGIISAIDRTVAMDGGDMTLVQTTAALNSGNSGGALVNAFGQVVGITNMKMMSDWETIEALGFAIPTASAKRVVDQLIERGVFLGRPALGIEVSTQITKEGQPGGAYVSWVAPDSDAYRKGIRTGDIIIQANGTEVDSADALEAAKEGLSVGDVMVLELQTARGTRTVEVELMDRSQFE